MCCYVGNSTRLQEGEVELVVVLAIELELSTSASLTLRPSAKDQKRERCHYTKRDRRYFPGEYHHKKV